MKEATGKAEKKNEEVPPWLKTMHNSIYFSTCSLHQDNKKNELDRFCIDCHSSICYNCLPDHALHQIMKIRRYVYSDVINRQDLCRLFNCSGIQTYHINKNKVVFLKQRPRQQNHQQQSSSRDRTCIICDRSLQDPPSLYCSIACKILAIYGGAQKEKNSADGQKEENSLDAQKEESSCDQDNVDEDQDLESRQDEDEDEEDPTFASPRPKRMRKGNPQRAPMF